MTTESNKQTQLIKRIDTMVSEFNSALPLLYTYEPGNLSFFELGELEENVNVLDKTAKKILYVCLSRIIKRYSIE